MSCEFISELRKLSKLSAEAVQKLDGFAPLKKYMHVPRQTEVDFRTLIQEISGVDHKQLVLVCGSAGDGKSHLLSYLKYTDQAQILGSWSIINDATESDAPNQTAIQTLAKRIEPFCDDRLDDDGNEKFVLAINLGMLNNFIDSEEGKSFSKLKQYVLENNIFSVTPPPPIHKYGIFHHIDFSDYQLYTLTAEGVKSDYLTRLFDKVFERSDSNTFYNAYRSKGSNCPHHKQCPVRHNFEFLMQKDVRKLLIQRVIEACVKEKLVVTSRDILNFLFDAIVSPNFNENTIWELLTNPAKSLETYISCTTPMLLFENKGTSSLIDSMSRCVTKGETTEESDRETLEFYAMDAVAPKAISALKNTAYSGIINDNSLSALNDGQERFKKYVYKFLKSCKKLESKDIGSDRLYLSFTRDLYYSYALKTSDDKNIGKLKNLYKSVERCICAWNGSYGDKFICIDDSSDDYSILESLKIVPNFPIENGGDEILRFVPVINVRFSDETKLKNVSFSIDYVLYQMIMAMKDGYCPTSQDRNTHADFSSGIRALSEFGSKKEKVFLVSKKQGGGARFGFEKNDFGYSFSKE